MKEGKALQLFKQKYRLTLENYLTYKEQLKPFYSLFERANNKNFQVALSELVKKLKSKNPTHEQVCSMQDTTQHDYYFTVCPFLAKYGYDNRNMPAATQNAVNDSIFRPRIIASTIHDVIAELSKGGITASNFTEKWDEIYENKFKPNVNVKKELESFFVKEFLKDINDFSEYCEQSKIEQGEFVAKILSGSEELLKNYKAVMAISNSDNELENVKTLRKLCDIYNLVVDVQADFSAYDDYFESTVNFLEKETKKENQFIAQIKNFEIDAVAHLTALETVRTKQYEDSKNLVVYRGLEKIKLIKKYTKLVKLYEKCEKKGKPLPYKKVAKLATFEVLAPENSFRPTAITFNEVLETIKAKDFDRFMRFDTMAKSGKLGSYSPYKADYDRALASNKLKLQELQKLGVAPSDKKLKFLNEVFLPFYVFTAAPLLDAMVQIVYFGVFDEFEELPAVMQNTKTVDTILKYFELKRVDTVKEAINLYIQENGVDENYEAPSCDERETKQFIESAYKAEEYRLSLKLKEDRMQEINKVLGNA